MSIIVQKFGGTSVADTQKILGAARKAIRAAQAGRQVVVVVSAMGKTTDSLVALAKEITDRPSKREMDMLLSSGEQVTIALLAIALESLGYKAVSMTGAQIGIKTDSSHTKARIKTIDTEKMRKTLADGNIVIAAGFQGVDETGNITTLGRGGSDTSAVALAAALGAEECEIYTDVDGIYTTDPRLLPEARKVTQISYDEMLELASLGAGVMHSRSIEFAKKFGVNVHVRSSFSDTAGSLITALPEGNTPVAGAAVAKNEAQVTLVGIPDKPGNAMRIFSKIADAKIATDMIVQNAGLDGKTDIAFTVPGIDLTATLDVLQSLVNDIGAEKVEWKENAVKVSIVGLGMETQPGVAETMFRAVSRQGINIEMITTSGIKISALVTKDSALDTLRAVHNAFHLQSPISAVANVTAGAKKKKLPTAKSVTAGKESRIVSFNSPLLGMEDILIEAITLDQSQARITLPNIPDKPGIAAEVFEKIAAAKIIVDMIVQSSSRNSRAVISFTVPRKVLDRALKVVRKLTADWGGEEPLYNSAAAILSVRGTGLRSHTGLAYRMFRTLADGGINVNIISTSERCVSVSVDDKNGEKGLKLFRKEFAKEMM
ncbi:MAG: aspartate kinase [Planctomycetaceae bacterium]|jgi:aspartate kinase|nr:aspartate kinase [Planctomycetaceae bacterium]